MKELQTTITTNGKEMIKCSNCGSEKKFVLIEASESSLPVTEPGFINFQPEIEVTKKQQYLAHLFEAQRRFGE